MSEYKIGVWLKEKQTGHLYEITAIIEKEIDAGIPNCVFVRRVPYSSGPPYVNYLARISVHYDIAPMAQILYSNNAEVTK